MDHSPFLERGDAPRVRNLRRENLALKGVLAGLLFGGACVGVIKTRSAPESQAVEAQVAPEPAEPITLPEFLDTGAKDELPGDVDNSDVWKARQMADADDFSWEEKIQLPINFDTRSEWLGCGTHVVDQGQCGDCWAASTTNVFGDRLCIHLRNDGAAIDLPHSGAHGAGDLERMFQQSGRCIGNGTMGMAHEHGCLRGTFWVAIQPLVSCCNTGNTNIPRFHPYPRGSGYEPGQQVYPSSNGCNGGELQDAWRYLYHEGLSTMDKTQQGGCTPYTSWECSFKDPENNGCHPCDMRLCDDTGVPPEVQTVYSFGWIMEEGLKKRDSTAVGRPEKDMPAMRRQVRKMQIEMFVNGPLHTAIDDYANFGPFFNDYPQGIYNTTANTPMIGGHGIELMGWGTDRATGMDFWFWKNSWGVNFANGGFARFIRGIDLLGIESDVWTGCPSGSNCKLTSGVVRNETWVPPGPYFPVPPGAHMTSTTTKKRPHRRLGSASTNAKEPSKMWSGGKEKEMTREEFSNEYVAPYVAAAVRHVKGPGITDEAALGMVTRVWSRSVRGMRLRVQVEGVEKHPIAVRHMEGHMTLHLP